MLSDFITQKLAKARYELLKDGSYYGEISSLKGVWADATTLDQCRAKLREVLEEWIVLKLRAGDAIAGLELPRSSRYIPGRPARYA